MQKETALKIKVFKMLHRDFPDIWVIKLSDRFNAGYPDIIGCLKNGHLFAIELKVHPNKATKLQEHVIKRIKRSGGIAGTAYSVDEVRNLLKGGEKSCQT